MSPAPRIRPYKDFLTPALHRRFVMSMSIILGLCYVEAVFVGEWNSLFWSWFPIGMVGIRTFLLFIPAFFVFLLRIAQLHVGYRTSFSGWVTFRTYAFQFQTVQTFAWYCFSAYVFSEIYIWSVAMNADLNKIKAIPRTDRVILNEKPIYLTCFFIFLAVTQAGIHLYYDYDRIDIPIIKKKVDTSDTETPLISTPLTQIKNKLPVLAVRSLQRALSGAIVSPFIYSISFGSCYSIRRFSWSVNRTWAKIFWKLPRSNSLPTTRPFHWSVMMRSVISGFLLIMLWEVGNAAFSACAAQEPLKNERPVTHASRDPNGSLLTGLRGKKLQTRVYAFWELAYISQRFDGRRKTIFEEIDRAGGSTWSQIRDVCLEVVIGISTRINDHENPRGIVSVVAPVDEVPSLPRMSKPLRDGLKEPGDLFHSPSATASSARGMASAIGNYAKSRARSPNEGLSPKTKKILEVAESAVLSKQQKEVVAASGFRGLLKGWVYWILTTNIGQPFRQEYRRKVTAVVLGSPYGDAGLIIDATDSMSRLAVCSLTEDQYGNVQRDIKRIVQTFTLTITKLEDFKDNCGIHWTDVEARQECPEVDLISTTLKKGLCELLDAFGGYSEHLGLSQSDMKMAREAAAASTTRESRSLAPVA